MSYVRYLRDHAASACVTLVSLLVVALVLGGSGMGDATTALVMLVLCVAALLRSLVAYLPRRAFWRDVEQCLSLEGADLLGMADLVGEPHFLEGRLAWTAFDALTQDYLGRIDDLRREGVDYHSFVEAWVHEVKTPIAAARLLTDNSPGQLSSSIVRELGRIDGYVEQALYYARSASLDRDYVIRELALSSVVRDAVKAHARSLIDQGVTIRTRHLEERVFADAKWVGFVLGQLIENAAKYRVPQAAGAGDGRAATLCFSATRRDAGLANDRVVLEVEDNGRGIPAADLPRVFDRGFVGENGRAGDATTSTGLGLFLVRRLCDKMGLGVNIASEQGSWTRVSISFPTNRMHYVERPPAQAPAQPA